MAGAYELLKNEQFHDDPRSIQTYITKRLSNCDLEAMINRANSIIAPTINALSYKSYSNETFLLSEDKLYSSKAFFSFQGQMIQQQKHGEVRSVK